jgi:hypothetical protein
VSIDFTGNPNGLFRRMGRIGRLFYAAAVDQAALPALFTSLKAQWTVDHDLVAPVEVAEDSLVRSLNVRTAELLSLARATLLKQVGDDVPTAGVSIPLAVLEVIRQMKASADSVKACTVGAVATAFTGPSNTGDGTVWLSTLAGDGLSQDLLVPESARLICTADSYTGNQTAGREPFEWIGAPQTAGGFDYDFPTGSGSTNTLRAIDPTQDATTTGNLLTNGDCESFTGGTPVLDNWYLSAGAWGTDIARSSTPHTGTYSVLVPATKTPTLYQQFGSTSSTGTTAGTAASMTPLVSYAFNFWLRRVSTAITAGTLVVELVDSGGTVINDDAGTANSFSVTLSGLTTSWAAFGGSFRLPSVPPSAVRLRLRVSVAPDQDFLFDDLAFGRMTRAYAGGPGVAVFAGATPFKAADGWGIATTNNFGGSSYSVGTMTWLWDRLFNMRGLGLALPVNAVPTIADSLITS